MSFQPLTEIHLDETTYSMEPEAKGNRQYLVIFTLLAIFILAIACVNFTNLTTVRGIKRAKEIGLRKTIGAFRLQLVAQLLGESLLAVTTAMVFAVVISAVMLEPFNALVGRNLPLNLQTFGIPLLISFGAMFAAGILSGIYPAAILSSIRPSLLIGYYFSDKWLNSFAYHTPLSLLPFLTAGTLAGMLAFITVGSQAIKIVFSRPSVMLRSE